MKRLMEGLTVGALTLLAVGAQAQFPGGPPPGGFGGGPGGFRPPPAMRAWQKWGDAHRNVRAVERTLSGLAAIESDPKTRLNRAQAKGVLAVIGTWRGRSIMTDAQARQVNRQILARLTVAQVKEITAAGMMGGPGGPPPPGGFGGGPGMPPPPGGRFGGHGPGGPPPRGPGGPPHGGFGGPPPGGMPPPNFPHPHEYNPLNPNTLPFDRARSRAARRLAALTAALKKAP